MKLTGTCPKCASKRVMHLTHVADAADWTGSGGGDLSSRAGGAAVPRRVLVRRTKSTGLFGGEHEDYHLAGEVEAYACAECGYFEEYLRDPGAIRWEEVSGAYPWSPQKGKGGPFR
jgi:hypothetical protein